MMSDREFWPLPGSAPAKTGDPFRIDTDTPPGDLALGSRVSDLPFPNPTADHQRLANAIWLLDNNPSGRALLPAEPENAPDASRFAGVTPGTSDRATADEIAARMEQPASPLEQIAQRSTRRFSTISDANQQNQKFEDFFNQHYEPVLKEAARLGVDPALMLGLAAHESNWGTSKQAINMNNPFGHTPDGKKPAAFPSLGTAWQIWGATHGPRIEDSGSDAEEFLNRLLQDNRNIYGPTVGGDRLGAYNDPKFGDRNWKSKVLGVIQSVRNRLPRWQAERGMLPRREE